MALINEAEWESTALEVIAELGWRPSVGTEINHEREHAADLVLPGRLLAAVQRFNPQVPELYLRQAVAEILSPRSQDAISENRRLHEFLVHGYHVKTDWTVRDDVRASLRAKIRRLLRKYEYPPDQAEGAVRQVIEQMEILAPGVAAYVVGNVGWQGPHRRQ